MICSTWTALALTTLLTQGASAASPDPIGGTTPPPLGAQGLFFEANGGRYDRDVSFTVRGPGYRMFLLPGEHRLALRDSRTDGAPFAAALRTVFLGADPAAEIVGEDELVTRIHYLRGKDPSKWSTDNRTFGRARYRGLWPGIDLLMYDTDGQLELEFEVAPGADPSAIRVRHDGVADVAGVQRMPDGRLRLVSPVGDLFLSEPVVYQDGAAGREYVPGAFRIEADGSVGFSLGSYDRSRTLVIDPVLAYSTYLAGALDDELTDVATDAAGNTYVCGASESIGLPITVGAFQETKDVETDALIAKVSPRGDTLQWCTYLGGGVSAAPAYAWANDNAWTIAVDATGHVYVGGKTSNEDFPTTAGAFDTSYTSGYDFDGFVSKLSPNGDALVWSTYLGGGGHDYVFGLAVDASGDVVVAGEASSVFPTTNIIGGSTGVFGFVTRIAATGDSLVYSTIFNGSLGTGGFGWSPRSAVTDLALDSAGRAYVAGWTNTSNFTIVNGAQTTWGGGVGLDGILVRLAADGSAFEYSTYLGGSGDEDSNSALGFGVAADDTGRAWFTCTTRSMDFPVKNAFQATISETSNFQDVAVACVDTGLAGNASLMWATYLGGHGPEIALDVETDGLGNGWVLCNTSTTNFDLVDPWMGDQPFGDLAVTAFDSGGTPVFSTYLGGGGAESYSSADSGRLTIDGDGNVLAVGSTSSKDLGTPGSMQTLNPSNAFYGGGFLAKFTSLASNADVDTRAPCAGGLPGNSLIPLTGAVLGQRLSVEIGAPLGDLSIQPGSITRWFASSTPATGYPCGVPIPGWGINGASGDLMVSLAPLFWLGGAGVWNSNADPAVHSVSVPDDPALDGAVLFTQGLIIQVVPGSNPIEYDVTLTNALDLIVGM